MMLKVNIDSEMIKRATKKAESMPKSMSKNAFMDQERHIIGFLGEEIFIKTFPSAKISQDDDKYDYDFTLYTKKIELKTKMVSSVPKPKYECSIYTYYNQDPDYYFFCRILKTNNSYPYGWLLGYISQKDFQKKSILIPKGIPQENGLIPKVNTWNIYIHQLLPMKRILDNIKKINAKRS